MTFDSFNVTSSIYTKIVINKYLQKFWWIYAMPLIISLALIFVNVNFIYVALTFCLVVYPMILSVVIFSYCLTKEIRYSILPKTMEVENDGLHLNFEDFQHIIAWGEMAGYTTTGKHLLLRFKTPRFNYFVIPFDCFSSKEQLREFVTILKNNQVYCN